MIALMPIKTIIAIAVVLFAIAWGAAEVRADYEYSNTIGSYWELSDKSSTLKQKSEYLDRYVAALQRPGEFADHDAVIYPTPNNSFQQNMVALLSLQGRMHQIEHMDESSFAYQTAIQQITAQEQGEAKALTSTFEGCWFLQNHPLLWGWHDALVWSVVAGVLIGLGILAMAYV